MTTNDDLLKSFRKLAQQPLPPADKFRAVLDRFVATLKEGFPEADASVEETSTVITWSFVTWPLLRPEERSIMLSFYRTGQGVQVFGEDQAVVLDPAALWDYLARFGTSEAFQATLLNYKLRNHEPAIGMLRVLGSRQASDSDTVVKAEPGEVRALQTAPIGGGVELRLEEVPRTTYAPFDPSTSYTYLELVGFGVTLTQPGGVQLEGNTLVVRGARSR